MSHHDRLAGTIPCSDARGCPYQVTSCGTTNSHATHDWRPRTSIMSAPQVMRHCPGFLLAVPSGWDGEED